MRNALLLASILAATPATVSAQEDSRLLGVVRLAQDGQGDSARAIALGLLSRTPVTDSLYPQVVYTMGLVARDADDRSRNFRRVAVEFAGSSWADDALLGLAQEDFAAGRAEASARNIERIKSDYPSSTLLPLASFWAARAYFELGRAPDACRWLSQGQAMAGEDVELQNKLTFYAPRCVGGAASEPMSASQPARRDTAFTAAASPPPTSIAPPPTGRFAVQAAAASTESAAQAVVTSLREAGFEPYLVLEGGFVKVRVGRFASRSEAAAAASQVRAKLGGSPFVVEEQ